MTRTAGSASASSMAPASSSRSAGVIVLYSSGRASTIERTPASVSVRMVFIARRSRGGPRPRRSGRRPPASRPSGPPRRRGGTRSASPARTACPLLVGGEAIGAEAALREAGELVGQLDRGVARPPALDQTVREAHAERLLARHAPPGEDQVHRLAVADEAGEAHGTEVDQRHAPAPAEDAEDGVG